MNNVPKVNTPAQADINNGKVKPELAIQQLIGKLHPHARPLARQADHSLNSMDFHKRPCVLLHQGHVSLCRQSDGLVLNSESAPCIFGFSNLYQTTHNLTIYPAQGAKLSILPLERAIEIVGQEAEWESLSKLLMYISHRIFSHCTRTSQAGSYETIRALLLEFVDEPLALRVKTPILQYIQSRCFLSRSGILRILAELRTGSYITIIDGRLEGIKLLPAKF